MTGTMRTWSVVVLVLTVACGWYGCASGQTEAQKQRQYQAELAREHASERRAARVRAARVERSLSFRLTRFRDAPAGCRLMTSEARPRGGIAPIACGDLGDRWPFAADWGFLRCEPEEDGGESRVIFTTPAGADYGVNVAARSVGYASTDAILIQPAADSGAKRDLEALSKEGLALCVERSSKS